MDSAERRAREALATNIAKFPVLILSEQIRAWLIVAGGLMLMTVLLYLALSLSMSLVEWLATGLDRTLRLAVEGLALLGLLAFGYRKLAPWIDRGYRLLRKLVAIRRTPWRTVGSRQTAEALRTGAPLGLYLRSYFDEDWLVPRSRLEAPARLAASGLLFIAVENSQARLQPSELLLVSVPNQVWRETVFALMDLAAVIVVDTQTDTVARLDWARGVPADLSFVAREAETVWRAGTVDELEHILARGHSAKTVVLAPRSWHDEVSAGKIARQIAVEEALALERHAEIRAVRGVKPGAPGDEPVTWFARTRLKRALLCMPHVVCELDQLEREVQTLADVAARPSA